MFNLVFKACFITLCFISPSLIYAQKNILLSEELSGNSDMLNVKMGSQKFGKIWNFRFGEYSVVESKLGWATTKSKSNFWGTKSESTTSEKFSFVLSGKSGDSAYVNAAKKVQVKSLNEIQLLPHFSWGNNELVKGESIFVAYITINRDTTDTWALFIKSTDGASEGSHFLAFLDNGPRNIKMFPVTSNGEVENKAFPARGYEFIEDGNPISALQYLGSGALGFNKNIIGLGKT